MYLKVSYCYVLTLVLEQILHRIDHSVPCYIITALKALLETVCSITLQFHRRFYIGFFSRQFTTKLAMICPSFRRRYNRYLLHVHCN